MVIIAWCARCARCSFRAGAFGAAELAARLAEAYRLIGELTARNERLSARVEDLERRVRPGFAGVVAAPVVGQPG
jgi:cell division protein FtsB